jgi:hypothetical protein
MIQKDVTQLNVEYLLIVRDLGQRAPLEAAFRFGLTEEAVRRIAGMTYEEIQDYARNGRAVVTLVPPAALAGQCAAHAALLGRLPLAPAEAPV